MKTTTGGYIRYFKEFILNLKVFDYIWFLKNTFKKDNIIYYNII